MRNVSRQLIYRLRCDAANLTVFLAVTLTAIFSIGGFAIETAMYMTRRQEVQSLAESVAMAAAVSLPLRSGVETAATSWYDLLRYENGRELAPASGTALTVTFDDNAGSTALVTPYLVNSVTVTISFDYTPSIFNVSGASDPITVEASATAQLAPKDIILIIENTASFAVEDLGNTASYDPFESAYSASLKQVYGDQCFSTVWKDFKSGVLELYDQLSQVGTYRVGVITSTSRTGEPHLLAELGDTVITAGDLEFDDDQPHDHSTRCAALTELSNFPVKKNLNDKGNVWKTYLDQTPLLNDFAGNDFGMASNTVLTTRDAIWMLPAGYSTPAGSGHIHPKHYYANPKRAVDLAIDVLTDSRRTDNFPVTERLIILLTDDAGKRPAWLTGTGSADADDICDSNVYANFPFKMGVVYYGHNQSLYAHDYDSSNDDGSHVQTMRANCLRPGSTTNSYFYHEVNSGESYWVPSKFETQSAPLIAHAIKEVELRF